MNPQTIKEWTEYNKKYEKKFVGGQWVDVLKKKPVAPKPFNTAGINWASSIPTEDQKKMNNGMTKKKIQILRDKLTKVEFDSREGRISTATSLTETHNLVRDILVLQGKQRVWQ